MKLENAIIIRDKTRLEQLIERFNSKEQARFYIERSGGDFNSYEEEHEIFYKALREVEKTIKDHLKFKLLYRSFLSTYIFSESDLLIILGQDGLLANTAKYVQGFPMIGINPDPDRYDGVLLNFSSKDFRNNLKRILQGNFETKQVTMAKASLNDGQELLAFNDFYIGANSHVSSRYSIEFNGQKENQSSSGIIISTGAGSTGWLSSIFNMAGNVNRFINKDANRNNFTLGWNENKLVFMVREPFLSRSSKIDLGCGIININNSLQIESHMSAGGVIFSDGIESDFLKFNAGAVVSITIAENKANIILN